MNLTKLKIANENGKFLSCYCPFHRDVNRPNLVINKTQNGDKPRGYWYCFSCGKSGQLSEKQLKGLCKTKAEKIVTQKVNFFRFVVETLLGKFKNGYPGDLVYDGSAEDYLIGWDGKKYVAPMYSAEKEVVGIQFQRGNKKFCKKGSALGLFLPYINPMKLTEVVITEGLKDGLVAYHCGHYSVGLPSAIFGAEIAKKFLTNLRFNGIIKLVMDSDRAGVGCIEELLSLLDKKDYEDIKVIMVNPAKDLREYYEMFGETKTKKLLELTDNE